MSANPGLEGVNGQMPKYVFSVYELTSFLLVCSFFIQITVYKHVASQSSLVAYHFLLPVCVYLYCALSQKITLNVIWLFFLSVLFSSILAMREYGFSLKLIQFLFAYGAVVCGMAFAKKISPERRDKLYFGVCLAAIIFLLVRNLWFFQDLGVIYGRTPYADGVLFMASGGRNLEATMLSLLTVLVIQKNVYKYMLMIALFSAILMQSRAGMVGVLASVFIFMLVNPSSGKYVYAIIALVAVLIIGLTLPLENYSFLNRLSISSDLQFYEEGQGRLALWMSGLQAFLVNISGYGVGNGVKYAAEYSGLVFKEDNFHNIYIQAVLDGGLVSGVLLLSISILILKVAIRYKTVEAFFCLVCLLLGMVQFTGYEPFIWFFLGVAYEDYRRKNAEQNSGNSCNKIAGIS